MGVFRAFAAIEIFTLALMAQGVSLAHPQGEPPLHPPIPSPSATPAPDLALEYRHALDLFEHGDYAPAAEAFGRLLYPALRLYDPEKIRRAHLYRGISLFLLDDKTGADAEFYQVLLADPDFRPDPLFTPPAVIASFDRLKTEHAAELRKVPKIPRDPGHDSLGIPGGASGQTGLPADFWLSIAPLGVAQFHNREPAKGWLLLTGETGFLALNLGTYLALKQAVIQGHEFNDVGTARTLQALNLGSGAALGAVLIYGTADGVLTASKARRARLQPAPGPGTAGLILTIPF